MGRHWVTADWHLGGNNTWRSGYREMGDDFEEELIRRHNSLVGKDDVVWVLGDACMTEPALRTVKRFRGQKFLVAGNHDIYSAHQYLKAGFVDILGCKVFKGQAVLTHIPVAASELRESWGKYNIHGHLHNDIFADNRYTCVSLEHSDYYPVELTLDKHSILTYH